MKVAPIKKTLLHLLIAWGIGLSFAGLLLLPIMQAFRILKFVPADDPMTAWIGHYFASLPNSILASFTFGLLLSLPLLLIAVFIAIPFYKVIARHPYIFILLAPVLCASIVATSFTLSGTPSRGFWEIFWPFFLSSDTWVFALPVTVSAVYFCLTASRQQKSASH